MKRLQELLDRRATLIRQAHGFLDTADTEKRDLTAEERNSYDAIMADVDTLNGDIERLRSLERAETELNRRDDSGIRPTVEGIDNRDVQNPLAGDEYRAAFNNYLRRNAVQELRAMSIGTDTDGGYTVPTELANMIVRALPNVSAVRKHANIITLSSDRDFPIGNSKGTVAWKDEAAAFTESTPTFTKTTLGAYKLTYLVKLSEELLADTGFDLLAYIAQNYADLAGEAMENKFCQGTGSSEIGGLIAGGSAGKTAAATAAVTADELIDFIYSLAAQYRGRGVVLMNSATAKTIRKLKNSTTGEYLWQPALAAGQPDSLLGYPVEESAGMPDIAASATPIIFGDLSYYTIAERGTRNIQRLGELYAANGQVGFRVYERLDAAVMLSAAIKKFTMAAE